MDRLAYLYEEDELTPVMHDWPQGVGLALCLSEDGGTQAVLFRTEAPEAVLARIGAATGWAAGSFAVSPRMPGAPTMKVLYSDAQALFRIIETSEGLARMAQSFDVDTVGSAATAASAAPKPAPAPKAPPPAPKPKPAWRPRISFSEPRNPLPAGFRAISEIEDTRTSVLPGEIRTTGARIRVLIDPETIPERSLPLRAERVGHRDDLRCFVIDPECLGDWTSGQGVMIDVPKAAFPRAIVDLFTKASYLADVVMSPEGIFVTPISPLLAETPAREGDPARGRAAPAPKKPRGRMLGLRAALFALVAVGLVSGSVVTALQSADPGGRNLLAYRPAEGNAAMNVLQSFAIWDARDGQ
ncbi:hypothetical protein [Roseivivax sp.]